MSDASQTTSGQNDPAAASDASTRAPGEKRKRGFPAPVTILTFVLILVWVAAFFIPSGRYELDASGSPVVGSFRFVPPPLDFDGRVQDLLLAPVNGMYGIQDPTTGQVGPFNKGAMFGSIEVFLFILSIGGFMTVVFATGALDLVLPVSRARSAADRGPERIV